MKKVIVYSLAFNTTGEVEKTLQRIYSQNDPNDFIHYLVDLDFPLTGDGKMPIDIEAQKRLNSLTLKGLANAYGSEYVKLENIGVSQNHTQFFKWFHDNFGVQDDDAFVSADNDECTHDKNWIPAMANVLRAKNIGMVCLLQKECPEIGKQYYDEEFIAGERVWVMKALTNFAQFAFKGEFIRKIDYTMPVPEEAGIYGYIEGVLAKKLFDNGFNWAILPEKRVTHTDDVILYREWKDHIIFGRKGNEPQISFEDWLKQKQNG